MRISTILIAVFALSFIGCTDSSEGPSSTVTTASATGAAETKSAVEPKTVTSKTVTSKTVAPKTVTPKTGAAPDGAPRRIFSSLFESPAAKTHVAAMDAHAKARILSRRGEPENALLAFTECLELAPNIVSAQTEKAALLRKLDRAAEALESLEIAEKFNGKNHSLLYAKAQTLDALEEFDSALMALDKIFADGVNHPLGRWLRTRILAKQKDREATIASLEDAIEHGYTLYLSINGSLTRDLAFVKEDERVEQMLADLKSRHETNKSAEARWLEANRDSLDSYLPGAPPTNVDGSPAIAPPTEREYINKSTAEYYRGTDGPKVEEGRPNPYEPRQYRRRGTQAKPAGSAPGLKTPTDDVPKAPGATPGVAPKTTPTKKAG